MASNRTVHLKFRKQLADIAPLPWQMTEDGGYITDANGTVILAVTLTGATARYIVAASVLCGIFTCGGFQLVGSEDMNTVIDVTKVTR